MTADQLSAIRSICDSVIRQVSPTEHVLIEPNVEKLRKGTRVDEHDEHDEPWAVGFGGADGFVFILPALLSTLGIFATEAVKKLAEEFAGALAKDVMQVKEETASVATLATQFESALRKRGVKADTARTATDVLVRTLAEDPTLLRRMMKL